MSILVPSINPAESTHRTAFTFTPTTTIEHGGQAQHQAARAATGNNLACRQWAVCVHAAADVRTLAAYARNAAAAGDCANF